MRERACMRNRPIAGTCCGGEAPRTSRALDPSAKMQSSAVTHGRVEPYRSECAPAAFVETIPPMVANFPLDGSTGKRSPLASAVAFTESRSAPGSASIFFRSTSTRPIALILLRSTMTPDPRAPPAILVPDPRGVMGIPHSRAHDTIDKTSSASRGIATACGTRRSIPAASE